MISFVDEGNMVLFYNYGYSLNLVAALNPFFIFFLRFSTFHIHHFDFSFAGFLKQLEWQSH